MTRTNKTRRGESKFPSKIENAIELAKNIATQRYSNDDIRNMMPRGTNHVAIILQQGSVVSVGYNHMRYEEPVHAEQDAIEKFIQSRGKQYQRCNLFRDEQKPQCQKHLYKEEYRGWNDITEQQCGEKEYILRESTE